LTALPGNEGTSRSDIVFACSSTQRRRTARAVVGCVRAASVTQQASVFYPGKNLGASGDGGAIMTNDDAPADWISSRREWTTATSCRHLIDESSLRSFRWRSGCGRCRACDGTGEGLFA
jgi:excinuclease UvrABC ATPase subunit